MNHKAVWDIALRGVSGSRGCLLSGFGGFLMSPCRRESGRKLEQERPGWLKCCRQRHWRKTLGVKRWGRSKQNFNTFLLPLLLFLFLPHLLFLLLILPFLLLPFPLLLSLLLLPLFLFLLLPLFLLLLPLFLLSLITS